jgi:hypothetical protein
MITDWLYLKLKLITKIVLSCNAHMLHVPNIAKIQNLKLGQLHCWKYIVNKNSNLAESVMYWRHTYLLCVPYDGVAFVPPSQRHSVEYNMLLLYTIWVQHQTSHLTTPKHFQLTTTSWWLENHKLHRSLRGLRLCSFLTLLNIWPTNILLIGHTNTSTHTPHVYNRRTQHIY